MNKLILSIVIIILLSIISLSKNKKNENFTSLNDIEQSICEECRIITGPVGPRGPRGMSSYSIARSLSDDPDFPSPSEWIHSLKGEKGDQGLPGNDGNDGDDGVSGGPGLSAFNIAKQVGSIGSDSSQEEWINSLQGADGQDLPPGMIIAYFPDYNSGTLSNQLSLDDIPPGWAPCDGQTYRLNGANRPVLADLGAESAFTTPNLLGRFIRGAQFNTGDNQYTNINEEGGNNSITLQEANLPQHNHTFTPHGTHSHNFSVGGAQLQIAVPEDTGTGPNPNANIVVAEAGYGMYTMRGGQTTDPNYGNAVSYFGESTPDPISILPSYNTLIYIIKLPSS